MKYILLFLATIFLLTGCWEEPNEDNIKKEVTAEVYATMMHGNLIRCEHPKDTNKNSGCLIRKGTCSIIVAVHKNGNAYITAAQCEEKE